MASRARRLLTARSTVLVLILLLVATLGVAVLVPQAGAAARPGAAAVPRTAIVRLLGLDRVFSTWWFLALSIAFLVSLAASTFDQLEAARARTFKAPGPASGSRSVPSPLAVAEVEAILSSEGYRKLGRADGASRFVKAGVGYWGAFLLHAGMTITAVFAFVYVVTEHRVMVRVVAGAPTTVAGGEHSTRRGVLSGDVPLPATVSLFRVEPTYGPDDHLLDVASALVFVDERGNATDVRVAINDQQRYRGVTVYQRNDFGTAFNLRLVGAQGELEKVLPLPMPPRRGAPAYGEAPLDGRLHLKAKYLADVSGGGILPRDPLLTLRLQRGDEVLAETALRTGESAALGPFAVTLVSHGWWTDVLFDGSSGTWGIFTGFAVLLLGAGLTFLAVPREAVVRPASGGSTLDWRATRFLEFYGEERDRIMARCAAEVRT